MVALPGDTLRFVDDKVRPTSEPDVVLQRITSDNVQREEFKRIGVLVGLQDDLFTEQDMAFFSQEYEVDYNSNRWVYD